ncbi:MAG TPA: choice-of-anchor tandem repeat GloVer-containing protein [Bryobacteraceae bacterium]|nr:choice-of-anchor tandem repeat GloVer-containing protein [Bryobacteraceae bacterium]
MLAVLDDPTAGVIRDSAGNLYGTSKLSSGAGLVYKVDASGNYSVLYNFSGGTDGNAPIGGLIRDAAGHLYGTTSYGGTNNSGVVFRLQ